MAKIEKLNNEVALLKKLSKLPMFALFREKHLKNMLDLSTVQEYDKFEPIIKETQYDNRIYIMLSGSVNVTKNGEVVSTLHRPGELFGEMCIIDGSPRSATIYAIKKTKCLVIDGSFIDRIPKEEKEKFLYTLYKGFVEVMSVRLKTTTEELSAALNEIAELRSQLAWDEKEERKRAIG